MIKKLGKHKNFIWAAGIMTVIYAVLGVFFDFYYDLNDDVLIKDMIEGCFSGTPSGYNNQMLYPLSFLISLPYHLTASVPWFAIFLCGCQFMAASLILARVITVVTLKKDNKKDRILSIAVTGIAVFLWGVMTLWETVYVQYTVTCGMLVAAACFLTYTNGIAGKKISRDETPSLILLLLAMNIRPEMFLLCCPFIAFTGMVMWIDSLKKAKGEGVLTKKIHVRYVALAGKILLLFIVSLGIDYIAYSGENWREYRDFFNARTEVYDYTWYPDYRKAETFYNEIGISETQLSLIDHYNFGLDQEIDADALWKIADYSNINGVKTPLTEQIKTAVKDYAWRSTHHQDAPFNFIVLGFYIFFVLLCICRKDYSVWWKLLLLSVLRAVPWMYVILSKRVPARISHPLYWIELVVLAALVLKSFAVNRKQEETGKALGMAVIVCLIIFSMIPAAVGKISAEQARREKVNRQIEMFDAFAKNHSENYYYLDVYSTVDFSEKMFADRHPGYKNYSILGGWGFGNPLLQEGIAEYMNVEQDGKNCKMDAADQLLQDNFYFAVEKQENLDYIKAFYEEKNRRILLNPVAEAGDFTVYHFDEKQ